MYSSHFSLESEREHAEEVDVQVKFSGLPCKIGHQSTVNLKTFGDFSLLCGLQFVEQQFKVVRNSFPFSIPTELYEKLTRL